MSHPSFLALDRFALRPEAGGEVATHLAGCETCRAHLVAAQRVLPVPEWVRSAARRRTRPVWFALPVAVALGLTVAVAVPALRAAPATAAKGAPSVVLWLKRGDTVAPWTGSRVRAGDALRLEVAANGYPHLAVVGSAGQVLHRGSTSSAPTLTPAWLLDESPDDERLLVVLSQSQVPDGTLPSLAGRRDGEVWSVEFTLKREQR